MKRLVAICTVVCALGAAVMIPAGAAAQSLNSGATAVLLSKAHTKPHSESQYQTEGRHHAGVESQRARGLRISAGGSHREPEVGAEKPREHPDAEQHEHGEHQQRREE